ncbi:MULTISPECIES: FecR domain-containing protein [Bradyrhizobium]|uniref:FecR domain-containing protein n=1 Tax=Bradyrhizobium TaxID=374 RepID=UPI00272AB0AB|nr:FecR domain-containing protein [Bradyrhizobium elkanii]WLA85361.1 FecR domain-containing protein [Bradyrhizobium elkanii]
MVMRRSFLFALLLGAGVTIGWQPTANAASNLTQLAQAQPAQAPGPAPSPTPATPAPATPAPATPAPAANAQPAAPEPIGNVATLTGTAAVTRNNTSTPLQIRDDIFANDEVATSATSSLGITFNDGTTFNLRANARITIDNYVYEDGGQQNSALFNVTKGTAAFVAAAVAKTGDMKISTPTATLGIRGTTGLVEVPEGATATSRNVGIKLYPDADGHVGRIEVNDRSGASLGVLTRGASGFAIRPGTGGARFAAVPLTISPQQITRDQGFVRQVHSAQTLGRQVVTEQRDFRRANPDFRRANPAAPYPNRGQPVQPNPQRQNGLPGQNRNAPQQPGQQNRPGQLQQPGQPNRPGQQPGAPGRQGSQQQPGTQQQGGAQHALPGQPGGATLPRAPGVRTPAGQQPAGQQPTRQEPARQGGATQPGGQQSPARQGGGLQPGRTQAPGGVRQPGPPAAQPGQSGAPRQGSAQPVPQAPGQMRPGIQQAVPGMRPGLQRPAVQARPGFQQRRAPPPPRGAKPPPRDKRQ